MGQLINTKASTPSTTSEPAHLAMEPSKKRKAEEPLKSDRDVKRRRYSTRLSRVLQENEDLTDPSKDTENIIDSDITATIVEDIDTSEEVDDFTPIETLLAPQEKFLLRSDPWNKNYLASTWSNDTTLLLSNKIRNIKAGVTEAQCSGVFPGDIWQAIFEYFDVISMTPLSTISKWHRHYYSALPIRIWRLYFRNQRWRLPHEIMNHNLKCNVVINDDKVDWINEVKRNYLSNHRISELVQEITEKIRKIAKNPNLEVFGHGLDDRELDDWEEGTNYLPNDLRALYKCCSYSHWRLMDHVYNKDWTESFEYSLDLRRFSDVNLPTLEIPEIIDAYEAETASRFEHMALAGVVGTDSDEESSDDYYLELRPNDDFDDQPRRPVLSQDDILSDGSDYEPSSNNTSEAPAEESQASDVKNDIPDPSSTLPIYTDSSSEANESTLPPSYGLVNNAYSLSDKSSSSSSSIDANQLYDMKHPMWGLFSTTYSWMSSDEEDALIYDPLLGAISTANRRGSEYIEIENIGTVVDMLQLVSDYLDDKRAPFWITSEFWKIDTSDIDIDEIVDDLCEKSDPFETLALEIADDWRRDPYIQPRALKMLAAAGKQFLVDVFSKAQETNALQPATLKEAAKKMYN